MSVGYAQTHVGMASASFREAALALQIERIMLRLCVRLRVKTTKLHLNLLSFYLIPYLPLVSFSAVVFCCCCFFCVFLATDCISKVLPKPSSPLYWSPKKCSGIQTKKREKKRNSLWLSLSSVLEKSKCPLPVGHLTMPWAGKQGDYCLSTVARLAFH